MDSKGDDVFDHRGTLWYNERILRIETGKKALLKLLEGSFPLRTEFHFDLRRFEHTCASEKIFPAVKEGAKSDHFFYTWTVAVLWKKKDQEDVSYYNWVLIPLEQAWNQIIHTVYRSIDGRLWEDEECSIPSSVVLNDTFP